MKGREKMADEKKKGFFKKFAEEFKAFALKGNVVDMAIGVIIGGAFTGIVTAFTNSFINPIISSFGAGTVGGAFQLPWAVKDGVAKEGTAILYGDFITAVINFIIVALVLFVMLKAANKLMNLKKKPEAPAAPTTKKCPYCLSEIPIGATRCAHCTSELTDKVTADMKK